MEHQQKYKLVDSCRFLHLVHNFDIAGYFYLLPCWVVIVQHTDQFRIADRPSDVNSFLLLLVSYMPIDSLHQHPLDYFFVIAVDGHHERSLSFMVGGISVDILVGQTEKIRYDWVVSAAGWDVERGIALDVDGVGVERNFSLAVLEKICYCFEVIVLGGHEEDIFVAFVGYFHVSSVSLEEVDHIDVAVQSCEMQGRHALMVLHIDPGFELVFEGRIVPTVS